MIKFVNVSNQAPYAKFKKLYNLANKSDQSLTEAAAVSTYCSRTKEVSARFVNIKFVKGKDFIFFTNYNSDKSTQIISHNQISVTFYWASIDTQIRIKGIAKKVSKNFSDEYFKKRSKLKNALAISSQQSKQVNSYEEVTSNYKKVLVESNLKKRPKYWGGISIKPYYFEFWTGDNQRINKREVFEKSKNDWKFYFLQP